MPPPPPGGPPGPPPAPLGGNGWSGIPPPPPMEGDFELGTIILFEPLIGPPMGLPIGPLGPILLLLGPIGEGIPPIGLPIGPELFI